MTEPTDPQADRSLPADPVQERAGHLGYVAHEIRNPMSTALWTAELLTRLGPADRGGARGEKLSTLCLRSLARVRLLVEDHLLCERLDAGGYPSRIEPVAVGEALSVVLGRSPAEGVPVEVAVGVELTALADRTLLERALEGLVAMAARDAAAVRVEGSRRDGRVAILVTGGPPAPLEDPHKGAPSEQRGRALALPMARRVAAALGGALTVEGQGYLLSIPAA
ncbi:MAG TPA: histidine kinase dimerization/phospho-acceptor domain-containing protein [Anaeromyxobacteraceae bacterium]|nr:histidine kinase dimerization/phospho-acceptor domain-containing protein [Anaeromyxobacteraceae bacterium]